MKKYIIYSIVLLLLMSFASAIEKFDLSVRSYDAQILQNNLASIDLNIENKGDVQGEMKVECGIYKKSTVQNWYGGALPFALGYKKDVKNCVTGETNVKTWVAGLEPGEIYLVKFTVRVPNTNVDDSYVWHCAAFENCYNTGLPTGMTDSLTRPFYILQNDKLPDVETCFDGIENQNEADTDCGGKCKACYVPPVINPGDGVGVGDNNTLFIILGIAVTLIIALILVVVFSK